MSKIDNTLYILSIFFFKCVIPKRNLQFISHAIDTKYEIDRQTQYEIEATESIFVNI